MIFLILSFAISLLSVSLSAEELKSRYESIRDKPTWPLEIFSPVSGTFGEYRNYNLHMGADFKTYGLNGLKILATTDGYISYLSQKDKGYGKSIHLYSPEYEITSKYAHLYSFRGKNLALEYLRQAMELVTGREEFEANLPKGLFPVKQKDWIALSGETGTGGPHLHLEFRNNRGFINPLFFDAFRTEDHFYPTILKMIWEDSTASSNKEWDPEEIEPGKYRIKETIPGKGRIRIKLRGYDWIRSQNRNNVYAMELRQGENLLYRKEFGFVPYSDSMKRYLYYDTNRSSLSPPIYYYNLFDYNTGYAVDLTSYNPGTKLQLQGVLEDASGKRSVLEIPIEVVKDLPPEKKILSAGTNQGGVYYSDDKKFFLDLKRQTTTGNGSLSLEAVDWALEEVKIPKGLVPTTLAYKISAQNFNWKGKAPGKINIGRQPEKSESLYFYDTSIGKFQWIASSRNKDGFSFQTEKLGIVGILKDEAPPSVEYVYQFGLDVHLPVARHPDLIERYYYLSDIGSGFTTNPEVYLEGEPYPFTYDRDRRAIRILFPKKALYKKKFLLLEIRPRDWAGNKGKYFTELLSL